MSYVHWSVSTTDFKTPSRHSAMGRRQARKAPRDRSERHRGAARREQLLAGAQARRPIVKRTGRRCSSSSASDLGSPALNSRTPRACPAPGVAQNLRRMLDRGEVREEPLPGGTAGYRIADDKSQPTTNGRDEKSEQ
jgi:hypothetical protein